MNSVESPLFAAAVQPKRFTVDAAPTAAEPGDGDQAAWLKIALVCTIYLIPVMAALRPVTDADIWWHLRVGQWIVEHQTVTTTDPFSTYGANRPWIAYSWLYEAIVYGCYAQLGLTGIVLFRLVLCLAVVAALHRLIAKREPRFLIASLLTAVGTLALLPLMTERPWLLTILFATLTLDVILDLRAQRRNCLTWFLPVIFLIWANTHIQFVYGLFLLAVACVAPVCNRLIRHFNSKPKLPFEAKGLRKLLTISGLCALGTVINPYGMNLYWVIAEYGTDGGLYNVIRELQAFEFRSLWAWLLVVLALATAFQLGRKKSLSAFELLLFAAAVYFAFRSKRDLWLMVLTAAVVLPGLRWSFTFSTGEDQTGSQQPFRLSWKQIGIVACLLLIVTASAAAVKDLSEQNLSEAEASAYPKEAIAVIRKRGFKGPLFNDYKWGGYLIWQLPELKVSIDGRANLHGGARLQRSLDTWSGLPNWKNDPELSAANIVLAPAGAGLTPLLRADPCFRAVHEDEVAVVFLREP